MVTQLDLEEASVAHETSSWLKQGPKTAVRAFSFLLPSFLHRYTPIAVANTDQQYELLSQPARPHTTSFLDGMRGLAALCVFNEHFLLPFWSNIFYSYGGREKSNSLTQLPIIRLLYSGSPMVCIFFVISGIVLSLKPARHARNGQFLDFYQGLTSSVFRRGIRLSLPCILASFVHMLLAQAHLCDVQSAVDWEGPAEIRQEFWLKQPQHVSSFGVQITQWLHFMFDKVLIPMTWRGTSTGGRDFGDLEHVEYGSQLWTVGVEFWSSMLLFVTLLGTARLSLPFKSLAFFVLASFSLWVSRWDVALFLFGCLLGHTAVLEPQPEGNKKSVCSTILFTILFCLGLHLASFPELGGDQTAAFSWLPLAENPRVWQSIGASLVVFAIVNLGVLRKVFSHQLLRYLGRISFSIYITHIPLLAVAGWRLVACLWTFSGRESYLRELGGITASFVILFTLQIWLADLFCRFVDEPCTRWASSLYQNLIATK